MATIPTHIGIIMDGNRRWAKEQGLFSVQGHAKGYEKLKEVGDWCLESGVKYLTVFGFSTENWQRAREEVEFLMELIYRGVTEEIGEFDKKGIRLRVIGEQAGLSERMLAAFRAAEEKTAHNSRAILTLAINYGGRAELVTAFKELLHRGVAPEQVNEALIASVLPTAGIPDPDLIIRTSGEQRTSGFLTWQSVYSELYFEPHHWPGFTREDFYRVLAWYAERQRRFGK